MSVFGHYARYYDLLYKGKDYAGEARFVHDLVKRYRPDVATILELGCGTGIHAQHLAGNGLSVYGVDRSAEMLATANVRKNTMNKGIRDALEFSQGDVRDVRIGRMFDAVISLFHVMSYQTTNADLKAAFFTAKHHLKPGGVFLFDCWYGPAVLSTPPEVRVRRLEDDAIVVHRIAEPVIHTERNVVDVNYSVLIHDKSSNTVEEIKETHGMRYLFRPEVELLSETAGLEVVDALEWVSGRQPDSTTWGVCFVVKSQDKVS